MQGVKSVWDFIQNEVLGMKWLNRLIGSLLESLGLDVGGKVATENRVEAKTSRDANRLSQPYCSARIEVVLPAGIPVISTLMLFSRGSMGRKVRAP